MARNEVIEIVERAVTDPNFRARLESDFENVVSGYSLTEEEKEALKVMNQERLPETSVPLAFELSKCRLY